MIKLSRLNGKEFYVNADLVEFIEETPDTVISLATGKKLVVEDKAQAVVDKVLEYRRQAFVRLPVILQKEYTAGTASGLKSEE